jgi:azurin
MKKSILAFASAALFLTACSDNATKEETPATETATPAATEPAEPAAASNVAEIALSAGDDMKFDMTEIKVKEGQTVKLTLVHTGKAPLQAMGHNFTLLAQGSDVDAFAKAAVNAKDNDYIPKELEKEVIAHTKTIGGGDMTEIEFPAPAKGTYDFLCSFPGHSVMMRGKFIVE